MVAPVGLHRPPLVLQTLELVLVLVLVLVLELELVLALVLVPAQEALLITATLFVVLPRSHRLWGHRSQHRLAVGHQQWDHRMQRIRSHPRGRHRLAVHRHQQWHHRKSLRPLVYCPRLVLTATSTAT